MESLTASVSFLILLFISSVKVLRSILIVVGEISAGIDPVSAGILMGWLR